MTVSRITGTTKAKKRRPPGRPKPEDVADIEDKLLAVALREFQEQGYGAASVTKIVKTAGMSKTTLYSRYPSKEHLFRAILKRQIERYSPWASLDVENSDFKLEQGLRAYASRTLQLSLESEELAVNHLIYSEIHRFPSWVLPPLKERILESNASPLLSAIAPLRKTFPAVMPTPLRKCSFT